MNIEFFILFAGALICWTVLFFIVSKIVEKIFGED